MWKGGVVEMRRLERDLFWFWCWGGELCGGGGGNGV